MSPQGPLLTPPVSRLLINLVIKVVVDPHTYSTLDPQFKGRSRSGFRGKKGKIPTKNIILSKIFIFFVFKTKSNN